MEVERRGRGATAGAHEVVVADRGAADGDDEVGAARRASKAAARLSGVSRAIGRRRASAPAASSIAFRPKSFEAKIWSGPGSLAGHDQLVAGGDQRDDRAARDGDAAGAHRGEEGDVGRRAGGAARRCGRRREVAAGGADVGSAVAAGADA